jgi:hypothetical protein
MATVIPDKGVKDEQYGVNDEPRFAEKQEGQEPVPPLGEPQSRKTFWFQRGHKPDPDSIATQVWRSKETIHIKYLPDYALVERL